MILRKGIGLDLLNPGLGATSLLQKYLRRVAIEVEEQKKNRREVF